MTSKLLFVDDDPNLLAGFQRNLRRQFRFDCAQGGPEAIELVQKNGPYAVVVCDMRMPGMDGVKTLERIRELAPDTVRVMLTGNADQQTAIDAVNRGQIFRFLNKPCPPDVLVPALESSLKHYELKQLERELLEGTLMGSVKALADLLGMVAPRISTRAEIVRGAIGTFGRAVGIEAIWELEIAALLSPIGFASVPPNVLRKLSVRSALSFEEEAMIRRVPEVGHELLKGIPRLENVAAIVRYQHKSFDGSGVPSDMCSGDGLPVGARMLKILQDRLALEEEGIVRQHALVTLKARQGVYDADLLERCFELLCAPLLHAEGGERPPVAISIDELSAGLLLARDVLTPAGLVLVSSGNRLTPLMVERLRNLAELGEVKEPFLVVDEPRHSPEPARN